MKTFLLHNRNASDIISSKRRLIYIKTLCRLMIYFNERFQCENCVQKMLRRDGI